MLHPVAVAGVYSHSIINGPPKSSADKGFLVIIGADTTKNTIINFAIDIF
jgi:hypothetical protein